MYIQMRMFEGFYIANGRPMVFYSNRLLEIDGEMQLLN